MAPTETEAKKKRDNIARIADVRKLQPFTDLNMIGTFAEKFSLDPDFVYSEKDFDTIINFAVMWKEQAEYEERYHAIEKRMSETPKQ